MKQKFTYLAFLVAALFTADGLFAQSEGDFQTASTGFWDNTSSWQMFHLGAWIAAPHTPTDADGVITILNGHTITIEADVTADQIVVQAGGVLTIDNNVTTVNTFTLADGTGVDLIVNGVLNLGGNDVLLGSGNASVEVTTSSIMNWTGGTLQAITAIDGGATLNLSTNNTKLLQANLTNSGTMNWATGASSGGIFLQNAIFTNIGTLNAQFSSNRGFADNGGTNSIVNTGIINKTTTFPLANFNAPFNNSGTIQGLGSLALTGTITNTGILRAGNTSGTTIGTLGTSANGFSGMATTLAAAIVNTGDVAGTNYNQLIVTDASGTVDLSAATLTITEVATTTDPIGTNYTILSAPNGATFSGTFATVNVPSDISATLTYSPTSVTASKIAPLPITWGPFDALVQHDNTVLLDWTTYLESNTSHFVVDYSTDGKVFNSIGTVTAAGNSSTTLQYSFKHTSPDLNGTNFYRLQELDRDGKSSYSPVRVVRFANAQALKVLVLPNPVHDQLQMTVQEQNITASLYSGDGRLLRTWRLQPGTQQVNIGDLPAGNYQLMVSQKDQQIETQHLIKL
jgi:hypothetical protein